MSRQIPKSTEVPDFCCRVLTRFYEFTICLPSSPIGCASSGSVRKCPLPQFPVWAHLINSFETPIPHPCIGKNPFKSKSSLPFVARRFRAQNQHSWVPSGATEMFWNRIDETCFWFGAWARSREPVCVCVCLFRAGTLLLVCSKGHKQEDHTCLTS